MTIAELKSKLEIRNDLLISASRDAEGNPSEEWVQGWDNSNPKGDKLCINMHMEVFRNIQDNPELDNLYIKSIQDKIYKDKHGDEHPYKWMLVAQFKGDNFLGKL